MKHSKVVELVFFYASILAVSYVMWLIFSPYFIAIALAGMLVLTAYPLYTWISTQKILRDLPNISALVSTLLMYVFIVAPIIFILFLLTKETVLFYEQVQNTEVLTYDSASLFFQTKIAQYLPGVNFSITAIIKYVSAWGVANLQAIFASILTFVMSLFVSIMATFFFFRDGKKFIAWLVEVSPLQDDEDELIFSRISVAVRSVLTGIILISLLQGFVAGFGFLIFGVPKPVLWGTVAAFGGLLPGIGTIVIMIPAVIYLYLTSNVFSAVGLLIWAILAIVIVDNIISPMLMGRGNALHPLLVLLSILGGISLMGMIGVIIGPVIVSVFLVLLELQKSYLQRKVRDRPSEEKYLKIKQNNDR